MTKHGLTLTATLSAFLVGSFATAEEEVELTMDSVPQAVRDAFLREAAGAKMDEVERETEDGVIVYEAEWTANGVEHEAAVTEDGALIEIEEEITLDAAPAAVQAAVAAKFGDGAKVSVERTMVVVYEIESSVNGKEVGMSVLATGHVIGDDDKGEDDDDNNGDE